MERFQQKVIFNLHIKPSGTPAFNRRLIEEVRDLLRRYEVDKHTYFMIANEAMMEAALHYAPDIRRCMGTDYPSDPDLVKKALKYKCQKIQAWSVVDQKLIDQAKANGIICNLFHAETCEEARQWLARGIDTLLTNDYFQVSKVLESR